MIIVTIIFRVEPKGNNGGGGLRKKNVILNLALSFLWHVVWPHGLGVACRHVLQRSCHRSVIDDVPFQGGRDSGSVVMRNAGDGLAVGGLANLDG